MLDKNLENQYLLNADEYSKTLNFNNNEAIFYVGVQYGLDIREEEVAALKLIIKELEIQINNK
jgi:hypothetical protein